MSLPYSNPTTSYEAAQSVPASKVQADRRAIAAFIASQGSKGATDEELGESCPQINANALRARRGECWAHSVITDQLAEVRRGASGLRAKVWHLTDKGARMLGLSDTWCVKGFDECYSSSET